MAWGGLRRKADLRALAFVAGYYALLLAEWRGCPFEPGFVVVGVLCTASAAWFCAVIAHNTLHSPLFRQGWANAGFQLALTCAYGFPVSEYVPGHNLSHHRHTQSPADVMRSSKTPFVRLNALN